MPFRCPATPSFKRLLHRCYHHHAHHRHPRFYSPCAKSRLLWFFLGSMAVSIWHKYQSESHLRHHDCFRYSWRPPNSLREHCHAAAPVAEKPVDRERDGGDRGSPGFKLAAAGDERMLEMAESAVDHVISILTLMKTKLQDKRLQYRESERPPRSGPPL